ncbi:MAG: CDP-alcohol phosphatidyltransferase family protein [Pyrodictiaceae archaeon]
MRGILRKDSGRGDIAMLTRLRARLAGVLDSIAAPLSAISANYYTILGLVLASLFPFIVQYNLWLGILVLLLSGFFDAIDGAVARKRGEASRLGSFIDSLSDRIADILYSYGFLLIGYPASLVLGVISLSLLISYVRSKYEALLGSSMEGVGIMERADRIIALSLILLIDCLLGRQAAILAYIVFLFLLATTLAQRVKVSYDILTRN